MEHHLESIVDNVADLSRLLLPIQPDDHVEGDLNAPYTLVEYGDYECPECGRLFLLLREIRSKLNTQLCIVFRHYPLSGIHVNAQLAAEAAEAAGAQDRFWDMHCHLFENQHALKRKDLIRHAEKLSLDVPRFAHDLKNRTYESIVRENFRRGVQNGVYGTPGLFINGVRHSGIWDSQILIKKLLQFDERTS
jgi:protein-disulfide isomerase